MRNVSAIPVRIVLAAVAAFALMLSASAAVRPVPAGFHAQEIKTQGATIHVRVGGKGPAVVMLHGFGDTGDMWAPLAAALAKDHTIIVPDLRGMGLSSYPDTGYDKKNAGKGYCSRDGQAQCPESRPGHARHRQHGRLRARRAIHRPYHTLGHHRCAFAGHWPVGRDSQKSPTVAFQLSRPGCRPLGERP